MVKDISKKLFLSVTDKQFLPIWLLLIVVMIIDVTTRLNTAQVNSAKNWEISENIITTRAHLSPQDTNDILAAFAGYDVDVKDETSSAMKMDGMSAEAQAEQQGRLAQLYVGNLRYRLMGVFADKVSFAILQQKDIVSGEQILVKVKTSDTLRHYQVEKILANQVIITSTTNKKISLDLYKKQLASEK